MPAVPVIISLGSNLGDRRYSLREAVRRLGSVARVVRISSLYETEPLESPAGSPAFLNLVVLAVTRETPRQLLHALQAIEKDLGRRRRARNEPRVLDLDLILFGSRIVQTGELTLPHPRYRSRNFVLEPMRELRIEWVDPIHGKPVTGFHGQGRVRRAGPLY